MPSLSQTLLGVVILSTVIAITKTASITKNIALDLSLSESSFLPPHSERGKDVSQKYSSASEQPNSKIDGKQLRRSKRQVIYEDVVDDRNDDSDAEEAILRRQLEQLTDDELASLSHIARNDMNRYVKPRYVTVPQYEIIEIPDEILDNAVMEVYPRDRRSVVPVEWSEVHEPEYFAVPQEAVIEALKQEQDEQELRDRIAELAQILNERAYRGGVRL